MTCVNSLLMDREERRRESATCKYCGEHVFECGCADDERDRRIDDEREDRE